jgi:phage tail sheath protein FI
VDSLTGILNGADAVIKDGGATFSPAFNDGGSIYQASLTGGDDGDIIANDGVYDALELFSDPETLDVNLVFAENDIQDNTTLALQLIYLAEKRKDCVCFISPDVEIKDLATDDEKLDDVKDKFDALPSSNYAVFDSSPVYMYDKYNDEFIWVPASGHIAGLCARTDDVRDPWWSPAGYNRGVLLGVTKLGFVPRQNHRDELYKSRINPLASFPGEGILLYGDKTAQSFASAFDRINVRRLFITLEKAIATAAKQQLFEFNDEFTRARFRNLVNPYLREVQGRRGITDFRVVCDETNNTGEVIDSNRFVADIYIKPTRSINFITLNFVAVRTDVEFEEIIGQF